MTNGSESSWKTSFQLFPYIFWILVKPTYICYTLTPCTISGWIFFFLSASWSVFRSCCCYFKGGFYYTGPNFFIVKAQHILIFHIFPCYWFLCDLFGTNKNTMYTLLKPLWTFSFIVIVKLRAFFWMQNSPYAKIKKMKRNALSDITRFIA